MKPEYIYESPDGGKTVYRRRPGSDQRELAYMDQSLKEAMDLENQMIEWQDILETAKSNMTLASAVDRVKMLYLLIKNHGKITVK
jgi:hypothetical protein